LEVTGVQTCALPIYGLEKRRQQFLYKWTRLQLHAHGKYRNKWNTEKGRQQYFFYIRMDKPTITNTRKIQTIKGNTKSKECQSKCM
jgi:hypothetical protein